MKIQRLILLDSGLKLNGSNLAVRLTATFLAIFSSFLKFNLKHQIGYSINWKTAAIKIKLI